MATLQSKTAPITKTLATRNEYNGMIAIPPSLLDQLGDARHWQIEVCPEGIWVTPYERPEFPDYTPPTEAEVEAAIAAVRLERKQREQKQMA